MYDSMKIELIRALLSLYFESGGLYREDGKNYAGAEQLIYDIDCIINFGKEET